MTTMNDTKQQYSSEVILNDIALHGKQIVRLKSGDINDRETRALCVYEMTHFLRNAPWFKHIHFYEVVCDDKNNTPELIDTNELVMNVYLRFYDEFRFRCVEIYHSKKTVIL